ncbi:MAG: carbohydrate deacetylase [Oscillospiraceae bacterium]|jgi:predicted glycoside hydrolase/deacetylase ChbG (UPF0249 family)|nr:carbohydrate deacetylase [Oscillospiraceae bacterium]
MKVIFNADDFGYSKGVNLGVLESYKHGLVRSTSLMATKPAFDHAVLVASEHPGLGIGAHLSLTSGVKAGTARYKTLTKGDGSFFEPRRFESLARGGELSLDEAREELEAQLCKMEAAGIKADHLDTHHHIHCLPGMQELFMELAAKRKLPIRQYGFSRAYCAERGLATTDAFEGGFYGEGATVWNLKRLLESREGAGTLEVMCHPAYMDRALYMGSAYNVERALEMDILTCEEMRGYFAERGHELCSFGDVAVSSV